MEVWWQSGLITTTDGIGGEGVKSMMVVLPVSNLKVKICIAVKLKISFFKTILICFWAATKIKTNR